MEQYDKYKTTHSSITFGEDDEQQRLEESDEQRAERYAKHQLQWQKYLTESKNLLKNVAETWLSTHEQYETAGYGYIIKANQAGGPASISCLCTIICCRAKRGAITGALCLEREASC
jgi:hypothetical protein